jgi:hypothetical protein
MLINFSARATHSDNLFYFDKNTTVAPSELLNAPASETPAPEVKVCFPRVDFSSGKNRPHIFESNKSFNNIFLKNFSHHLFSSTGFNLNKPVYLLNSVFRI